MSHHDGPIVLAFGERDIRVTLALGNLHLELGIRQRGLHLGLSLRLVERSQFVIGLPLMFVGCDLLDRQLPQAELFEQRFDLAVVAGVIRLANQHVHAFDVELVEAAFQFGLRLALDHVALVQQSEHRLFVSDIPEVGRQQRIERLRDQLLHVTEPLNDARCTLVVDVNDDRQRQRRLVGIPRDEVDRTQVLVVAVSLRSPRDPVQDKVRRRDEDDVPRIRVERVLARSERPFPHAAFAFGNSLTVTKRRT